MRSACATGPDGQRTTGSRRRPRRRGHHAAQRQRRQRECRQQGLRWTTQADVTLGALTGLVGSETLGTSASGRFDTKDVGTAKLVSVDPVGLVDGGDGGLARNYRLAPVGNARADITPRPLTVEAVSAANKVYDASTVATVSGGALGGLVGSETLATHASRPFCTTRMSAPTSR